MVAREPAGIANDEGLYAIAIPVGGLEKTPRYLTGRKRIGANGRRNSPLMFFSEAEVEVQTEQHGDLVTEEVGNPLARYATDDLAD